MSIQDQINKQRWGEASKDTKSLDSYAQGHQDMKVAAATLVAPLEASHGELLAALLAQRLVNQYEDPWRDDLVFTVAEMRKLGFGSEGHENELAQEFADRLRFTATANAEKLNNAKQ